MSHQHCFDERKRFCRNILFFTATTTRRRRHFSPLPVSVSTFRYSALGQFALALCNPGFPAHVSRSCSHFLLYTIEFSLYTIYGRSYRTTRTFEYKKRTVYTRKSSFAANRIDGYGAAHESYTRIKM